MRKIGFSGTQDGMTEAQKHTLASILPSSIEFHHGDCVGADEQAHKIALAYQCRIVIHPHSLGSYKRAFCQGDEERPERPPLIRNADIARETSWLISAPKTDYEVRRSGTWTTIRRARSLNRKVTIIFPDGSAKDE